MTNFTPSQIATAQQVLAAVPQATPTQQLALMEAGLVESGMQNLNYGDRDSMGVFQERPSQGWTNVTNITAATQQIYAAMNKSLADPGQMAQSAERSAYPARYDQMQSEAESLLAQAKGGMPQLVSDTTSNSSNNNNNSTSTSSGNGILSNLDPVTSFENWVTSWSVRVGLIVLGALFMLIGIWLAFKDTGVGKVGTTVAKTAAFM